jgi:uncharacterized protein YjdB
MLKKSTYCDITYGKGRCILVETEEKEPIFTKKRIIIGSIVLLLLLIIGYFLFFSGSKDVKVESLGLAETNVSLKPGDTFLLRAYVSPANATNKSVQYTTTDATIITVSNSGLITAIGEGTAQIVVLATNGKQATCTVTVGQDADLAQSLVVENNAISIVKGGSKTISVSVTPTTAPLPALTYTSSNSNVATVDASGKVTAKGVGTATITISGVNANGTPLTTEVKVTVTRTSGGGNTTPTPDKTAPTCTLKLDGSNVVITGKDNTGLAASPYSWDNQNWAATNTKTAGTDAFTYKAYVKDKAGNIGNCSFTCSAYTKASDNVSSCTASGTVGVGTTYTTCSNGYQYRYTVSYFCDGKYDNNDDVSGTYSSNYYYASSTNALNACNSYMPPACNTGLTNPPSRSCSTQSKVTYHIQKTYTRT